MIKQLIEDIDASLMAHKAEIVALAEQARTQVYSGTRYGGFPETNSEKPIDGVLVIPDNLTAKFYNEPVSLADLGVTSDDFQIVNGVGFRILLPDDTPGFKIEYSFKATVQDNDDLTTMATFLITTPVNIGDVITFYKTILYLPSFSDSGWRFLVEPIGPFDRVA